MAWEEDSCICLNMQLIAILSRIGVEYSTKDSNKQRGKVVGDSCLAFKTSCFHNVYYKPTLFPGVVFI